MGAQRLLTINTGSSSLKVALYRLREDTTETPQIRAEASRIGGQSSCRGWAMRTTWTSCRHSRCTSLTEKPRLPAAFGIFPIGYGLPFLICLLLEPAVNESAHQGTDRNASPEAVAAQAQIRFLFEPHGHRFVAQWAHRHPPAYTSSPQLAQVKQAAYVLLLTPL